MPKQSRTVGRISVIATKMSPPVADLKWIIENGIEPSGMPGWKGILDDDEMWKIVHYMRLLPPKGSLGVPEVFKQECKGTKQSKAVRRQ